MTSLSAFYPQIRVISAISQANPCVVTTASVHNYMPGLYVRIVIPYRGGMQPINGQIFPITILSPTTFSIPVDSTNFNAFVTSSLQSAQSVPVSEANDTLINSVNNIGPRNPI